jgi:hypothetical protein
MPEKPRPVDEGSNRPRIDSQQPRCEIRRPMTGLESWVYVNVEGTRFFVPEDDIDYKTDEPYCVESVKEYKRLTTQAASARK